MNRCIPATAALAFSLALSCLPPCACGEGQFNMGQGLRYQGYLAPHPATVLVYDDGASDRKALYAGLQKAGHKVTVVGTADAMSQALRAGHYDVVIADFDDAAALQSRAAGTSDETRRAARGRAQPPQCTRGEQPVQAVPARRRQPRPVPEGHQPVVVDAHAMSGARRQASAGRILAAVMGVLALLAGVGVRPRAGGTRPACRRCGCRAKDMARCSIAYQHLYVRYHTDSDGNKALPGHDATTSRVPGFRLRTDRSLRHQRSTCHSSRTVTRRRPHPAAR